MATRILHRTQLFEGILKENQFRNIAVKFVKIQSIVFEEIFFEGRVYGCTTDRWTARQTDGQAD